MQYRTVNYHELDTSTLHNTRLKTVLKAGVYSGYSVRVNIADASMLDITFGIDLASVLLTAAGVRIEEDSELIGVLQVQAADTSFSRYDLVVAEYTWSPDNTIDQVYRIIRGKSQTDVTIDPEKPQPLNLHQIPLAWVLVRPRTAVSGVGRVVIEQKDVILAPMASLASPADISTLKPIIDVTNRKRIYVYPGLFPNIDGTEIVDFPGAYSDEIDDTGMVAGDERYFLYGVSDDSEVGVAGTSATSSISPDIGANVLPLCIAHAVNHAGVTSIDDITDIRFPFSRRVAPQPETDFYQDALSQSVFEYVRIDDITGTPLIDLTTMLPVESSLTAKIEHGDTSVAIEWVGAGAPSTDVTITTTDLLSGTEISNVRHIMILIDTSATGVTFDYSTTTATGGFTGQDLNPTTIQEIPGGGSRLYVRFKIPSNNFTGGAVKKIFSYAVYMVLDEVTLNERVITSLGLDTMSLSIPNLICNGDFRRWSRPDAAGVTPDIDSRDRIDYPIDAANAADLEKVFAADGWQFTKLEKDFEANSSIISRVLWSRDVLNSTDETTLDYTLEWKGSAGTQGLSNHLEFRVPNVSEYVGNYVTFAFDYRSEPREAVGLRIVLYERESDGSLSVLDYNETGGVTYEGTLLLRSGLTISNKVFAIGFVIIFQQTTAASTVYVRNARAAIGDLRVLPFTRPRDADMLARQYYERGTAYASSNVADGDEAGTSSQYGSQKFMALSDGGEARVRQVNVGSANRSANITSMQFIGTENGLVIQGPSNGGNTIIDVDWESSVVYPISTE